MSSVAKKKSVSVNTGVSVNGKVVYATPTGLKIGPKGRVCEAGEVLGLLSKGDARKVRKACRLVGLNRHAAAKRLDPMPVAA